MIWPTGDFKTGVGSFVPSANPVNPFFPPAMLSTGEVVQTFSVPFQAGDRVTGFSVTAMGNNVSHAVWTMFFAPNMTSSVQNLGEAPANIALPASWVTYPVGGGFHSQDLTEMSYLTLEAEASAAGIAFGPIVVTFDRPAP